MAAEIMASELNLLMCWFDLQQVVNKYVGEAENNIRRIFDAADNVLLFCFGMRPMQFSDTVSKS